MDVTGTEPAATEIELRRTFAAPRETIFDAWTQAATLSRWFAPSDDFRTVVHALDLRVGGGYRIEMVQPGGTSHIVTGTYREIARPDRLVFTWQWEASADAPETVVSIQLFDRGSETELVLTHRRFAERTQRDEHLKGWTGCLARLAGVL
jgi:uncharacterized protein YndB with AHSA1/START domain